ncbi:MAG: NifB/NifX family molybdenum-iron cluster-binding protein [Verrucomicrobiota bacterium]
MLVAIASSQGRVSPVFDVAGRLTTVRLKGSEELSRAEVALCHGPPADIARHLTELGTSVLICGAISEQLESAVSRRGIRIIPRVCGEIDEVLRAFETGRLKKRSVPIRPV